MSFARAIIDLIPDHDDDNLTEDDDTIARTKEAMLDVAKVQIETTVNTYELCHSIDASTIAFAAVLNAFENVSAARDLPSRKALLAAVSEAIGADEFNNEEIRLHLWELANGDGDHASNNKENLSDISDSGDELDDDDFYDEYEYDVNSKCHSRSMFDRIPSARSVMRILSEAHHGE